MPQLRKGMSGLDNVFVLLDAILFLVGLFLLILGFATTDPTWKNVLLGSGTSLLIGAVIAGVQLVHSILAKIRESGSGADSPLTVQPPDVEIVRRYSEIDVARLIRDAQREVSVFVVSGRHMLSPQVRDVISEKIRRPGNECKIRVLALDSQNGEQFVRARGLMMNLPGVTLHAPNYQADLRTARLYARQITDQDPTHSSFDMRFYDKLPTTFFLIVDDVLYVSFLLSQPVSACPVVKIQRNRHPELAKAFSDHFDHYWNNTRFFVSMIGLNDQGEVLLVKNRKRAWEFPTGYIEPSENTKDSAVREFGEETGYSVSQPTLLDSTGGGQYFVGKVGDRLRDASAREVSEIAFFEAMPTELSFPDDRTYFEDLLAAARGATASNR